MPGSSTDRKILIYGLDPVLLDTRRLILEHAGFEVEIAHTREGLGSQTAHRAYDLWVLCHTVPEDQRADLSRAGIDQKTPVFQIPTLMPPDTFLNDVRNLLG